jgi:2-oxoglutarate dehydrogenase E2 component (dihydrolipoamide succinyltransferase)
MNEISGTFRSPTPGPGALARLRLLKPQAILGVHKIVEKPVVRDGQIVIRPIMNFGLSFDHRVIDGAYAVQFLRLLIEYLEEPDKWLLDVI